MLRNGQFFWQLSWKLIKLVTMFKLQNANGEKSAKGARGSTLTLRKECLPDTENGKMGRPSYWYADLLNTPPRPPPHGPRSSRLNVVRSSGLEGEGGWGGSDVDLCPQHGLISAKNGREEKEREKGGVLVVIGELKGEWRVGGGWLAEQVDLYSNTLAPSLLLLCFLLL